jgi:catechol 2,3-dioxygenase-like lactoylglutathione lyase family enzyme
MIWFSRRMLIDVFALKEIALRDNTLKSAAHLVLAFCIAACAGVATVSRAQDAARPAITGISHICVYSADAAASEHFYAVLLGARKGVDVENPAGTRYYFSPQQFVEVLPLPAEHTISRLAHIGYNTTDAAALRSYMMAHGVAEAGAVRTASDGSKWFAVKDPEGNEVQFVQPAVAGVKAYPGAISGRIIHVGFLVHNRADEDKFYKGVLGFKPYWYGSMRAGTTDWVSQQTPEGHDWLEYMMVGDGSTTPLEHVDARELGVLNHFSLGVANMEQTVTTLTAGDRLSPRHDGPSMGKDGKWQANFYDPDGSRVEFMEFQPVMKPCCSEFTADSPKN